MVNMALEACVRYKGNTEKGLNTVIYRVLEYFPKVVVFKLGTLIKFAEFSYLANFKMYIVDFNSYN